MKAQSGDPLAVKIGTLPSGGGVRVKGMGAAEKAITEERKEEGGVPDSEQCVIPRRIVKVSGKERESAGYIPECTVRSFEATGEGIADQSSQGEKICSLLKDSPLA
jgi:hypothetical protein